MLAHEMYLPLSREVFDEICSMPAIAVNVVARSVNEAAILLKIELAQIQDKQLFSIVVFLQSVSMTMRDFEYIDTVLPSSERFKRCLSFTNPEYGEVNVWLFATTCKN